MSRLNKLKVTVSNWKIILGSGYSPDITSEEVDLVDYAIKQVERAEEVERTALFAHAMQAERIRKLEWRTKLLKEHIVGLREDNQRYKQALEFYGDEYNWHEENTGSPYMPYYESDASKDGGETARKALEGES